MTTYDFTERKRVSFCYDFVQEIVLNLIADYDFEKHKDNLAVGKGSFRLLKSEYKRRFKNFFDALKAINNAEVRIFK